MKNKILMPIIILFVCLSLSSCKVNYNKKEYKKININDINTWVNPEKKYLPTIEGSEKVTQGMSFEELILLMGRPNKVYGAYEKKMLCYKLDIDAYCFILVNPDQNYIIESKIISNNKNSEKKEHYFFSEIAALNEDKNSTFNDSKEIIPNLYDITKIEEGMFLIDMVRILGRPNYSFGSGIVRYVFELEEGLECHIRYDFDLKDVKPPYGNVYIRSYCDSISIKIPNNFNNNK